MSHARCAQLTWDLACASCSHPLLALPRMSCSPSHTVPCHSVFPHIHNLVADSTDSDFLAPSTSPRARLQAGTSGWQRRQEFSTVCLRSQARPHSESLWVLLQLPARLTWRPPPRCSSVGQLLAHQQSQQLPPCCPAHYLPPAPAPSRSHTLLESITLFPAAVKGSRGTRPGLPASRLSQSRSRH